MTSNYPRSPTLLNCSFGTCLLLGKYVVFLYAFFNPLIIFCIVFKPIYFRFRSGSGKTTLTKTILNEHCKRLKKPIFQLVNTKISDYADCLPADNNNRLLQSFSDFSDIKYTVSNCIFVIEDIIHVDKQSEQLLRKCLNYFSHHKKQKYFFLSHSIYKTSLYSMVPFFNFIVFTTDSSNESVLRDVLRYFRLDKTTVQHLCHGFNQYASNQQIAQNNNFKACFYLDLRDRSFYYTSNIFILQNSIRLSKHGIVYNTKTNEESATPFSTGVQVSPRKIIQQRFHAIVRNLSSRRDLKTIFSIILPCLNIANIRLNDLTYAFRSTTSQQKIIRISIIDYLQQLINPEGSISKDIIVLHHYISSQCKIPQMYIRNKFLQS